MEISITYLSIYAGIIAGLIYLVVWGILDIIRGVRLYHSDQALDKFIDQVNNELILTFHDPAFYDEIEHIIKPCYHAGNSPHTVAYAITLERE